MIEQFFAAWDLVNGRIFLFSALIFMIGYALAPTVHYKRINLLMIYPIWMEKKLSKIAEKNWKAIYIFLFILILNSLSLFLDLSSGLILFLPLLMALLMGLNIGIITYDMLKGQFFYTALFNPVTLFELPAAFISLTFAFQLNLSKLNTAVIPLKEVGFKHYFNAFLYLVIPLLIISAIIETLAMKLNKKYSDNDLDQ
jgi:hypothetical protein